MELKKCPFCGSIPFYESEECTDLPRLQHQSRMFVHIILCEYPCNTRMSRVGSINKGKDRLLEAWNRRA
jgi:hypothetical protein